MLYDFECEVCGVLEERNVPYEERNDQECAECGNVMRLGWRKAPGVGKPGHQTHAVFADPVTGKTVASVPGHFGKEAKRKRKKK